MIPSSSTVLYLISHPLDFISSASFFTTVYDHDHGLAFLFLLFLGPLLAYAVNDLYVLRLFSGFLTYDSFLRRA